MLENARTKIMMNETLLFDSLSSPVPELRRDIQVIPIQDNGNSVLYFHDAMGYTTPNFALNKQVEPVLSLITGSYSITKISELLNGSVKPDELLDFVQLLDQHRLLNSKHFRLFSNRIEKDFEASDERKPALSGESYPADPKQLETFLNELFSDHKTTAQKPQKALYAPHIDLRVGSKQYAQAFSSLKNLTPKRVVIIGTSHYAGYYNSVYENSLFIGSDKRFNLPGKKIEADREYLDKLSAIESSGFTLSDRAHRVEHSIEIHLLFLSHLWQHDFKIVPILVSGFDELFYHSTGHLSDQIEIFTDRVKQLDDNDTFYLISGDLSHVGKKFGDPLPAAQLRDDVEASDKMFMEIAIKGDALNLRNQLAKSYDSTRICGYPPLYAFLKAFPNLNGEEINYHWWDESERESAVSFGSIAY
jgi:MEMO1 family protein